MKDKQTQAIQQQIKTTLQDIYRKAVDADSKLDALKSQQQGKFTAILSQDSGFEISAKRFLPYVEELSADFDSLSNMQKEEFRGALPGFVAKMEIILRTLASFKAI